MTKEDEILMMEIAEKYGDVIERMAEKYGGYDKLGEKIAEMLEEIDKE